MYRLTILAFLSAFTLTSIAQCDVYIVDGTATYEDLNPGVVFTFDIQNDGLVPYESGQFHLGFGIVTSEPVWYIDLEEPLLPGESTTLTTPIFDIPTPENYLDWPMWDLTNPNWNETNWSFIIYLNYCNFNSVFIDGQSNIQSDNCPNSDGDQFCNWCKVEVINFNFPEITLFAENVNYCDNPWPEYEPGALYLFQIEFIPEPGQISINNSMIVPDMYTGDIATYNLLELAGNQANLIEQLWIDSCELSIKLDFPNNLQQIGFDTTLVYSSLPCLLPCDTVYITDTVQVVLTDTIEIIDTLYIYETIYEVDTVLITEIEHIYHTDTVTEYIVETLYIDCFTGEPCDMINGMCTETSIFVPNAFTPNNDGFNDVFKVETDPNCWQDWNMQVYNRWGDLMWESFNPESYWLGGEDYYAQTGTYIWKIQAISQGNGIDLTGHVTLLR